MRLIFIYAGDLGDSRIQSPYCITNKLYNYLSKKVEIKYYKWDANEEIKIDQNDVILGHPNYPPHTPIQRIFASGQKCRAKCLIHPLHTNRIEDNIPFDHLAKKADKIFSICGEYWYDTIDKTPFASWKPKITRLDMAVDLDIWPYKKLTFNDPQNRRLLYVGSAMPQKNLQLMTKIMAELKEYTLHWYGGSNDHPLAKLPNVKVEGWQEFTGEKVDEICRYCDIFINTSYSDANPTTLNEFGLATGIIPICTKESGYYNNENFINIPQDHTLAVKIIREWLLKPSYILEAKSKKNREKCKEKYTWEIFCNKVWNGIKEYF